MGIYNEDTIDIHGEVFDKDFDNVKYEPDVIDDSDKEQEEKYGYGYNSSTGTYK